MLFSQSATSRVSFALNAWRLVFGMTYHPSSGAHGLCKCCQDWHLHQSTFMIPQFFSHCPGLNFIYQNCTIAVLEIISSMKSKQTAVRGPTGGGRPPVTGFYWNPCIDMLEATCLPKIRNIWFTSILFNIIVLDWFKWWLTDFEHENSESMCLDFKKYSIVQVHICLWNVVDTCTCHPYPAR